MKSTFSRVESITPRCQAFFLGLIYKKVFMALFTRSFSLLDPSLPPKCSLPLHLSLINPRLPNSFQRVLITVKH